MASVIERNVPAPRKRDHRRATRVAQRLALLLMVIAIWGMASLGTEPFVLPSPLRVWHAFVALIANGMFFADLSITLYRVVVGFVLAAIVGTVLGMVLGSNKTLADFFEPVLAVMNTVSSAIWAIFAIIWFGISNATTICAGGVSRGLVLRELSAVLRRARHCVRGRGPGRVWRAGA